MFIFLEMTEPDKPGQNFEVLRRTKDVKGKGDVLFRKLPLPEPIKQALDRAGFKKATPIQQEAIPEVRKRNSCIVHGKSGTGKTVIFAIAVVDKYMKIQHNNPGLMREFYKM